MTVPSKLLSELARRRVVDGVAYAELAAKAGVPVAELYIRLYPLVRVVRETLHCPLRLDL